MLRVSEDGNQRRESYLDSYRQLTQSLLHLQSSADQVFDQILQRTAKEKEKLDQISRRIQAAKGSIDTISCSKQPLVIKSPSRYPSSCITEEDFQPLFQYKDEHMDGGLPKTLLVNGGLNREFGKDGTLELFQFFSEENTACPSTEAQLKMRVKPTISNENFLGDLLEESHSFLTGNGSTSVSKTENKKQELPPAPPSLFLHNIPSLRKAEAAAVTKPVNTTDVPDTLSDHTHQRNDDHSDPVISDSEC
ncbi:uncharacterized protein M6B38_290245 [Iris pallida]|uniref:WASH1 WAHD domain-containing protein n=1 Tax=Iris pallida TaxID=29817 RepID=A0AAX6HXW3_IRIPA|nr:uncharacterized protein M6B38_290245 [Iris pallida]